jgi:hypothetical protein
MLGRIGNRAEVRYLPQSLLTDVPRMVAGLRVGQSFSAIPVSGPPVIRKGANGSFLQGTGVCEPSRCHSQRQHGRQLARGLASSVVRREKTIRRHGPGLSDRPDAFAAPTPEPGSNANPTCIHRCSLRVPGETSGTLISQSESAQCRFAAIVRLWSHRRATACIAGRRFPPSVALDRQASTASES